MPFGEMKIPAPMMVPMMMEIPRSRVTFFPSSTFLLSSSCTFRLGSDRVPFWETPFAATLPSFSVDADLLVIFFCQTLTHTQCLFFGRDSKWISPGICSSGLTWTHSACVTGCRQSCKTVSKTTCHGVKTSSHTLSHSRSLSLFLSSCHSCPAY